MDIGQIIEELDREAPKIRLDCLHTPRPCPWVRCRWHMLWLLWDDPVRMLRMRTSEQLASMVARMRYSCVLDICDMSADYKEMPYQLLGDAMRVTKERVRQIIEYDAPACPHSRAMKKGALVNLRRPQRARRLRAWADYEHRDGEQELLEVM